jgi:hypothetical protein
LTVVPQLTDVNALFTVRRSCAEAGGRPMSLQGQSNCALPRKLKIHDNDIWIGSVELRSMKWRAKSRSGLMIGKYETEREAAAAVEHHHRIARASH